MRKVGQCSAIGQGQFNTLAQNGTASNLVTPKLFQGNGSDLYKSEALQGRAKRKLITQNLTLGLVDIAKKKRNEEMEQHLWNTYHCQEKIFTKGDKLHGNYCKNRICTLCNSIRKAHIINRYLPIIQQWEAPYFITLTIKSVSAKKLAPVLDSMLKGFLKIIAKYKKRHQRGTDIRLMGIKTIESNFNPIKRTYNPHLHLIVPNKEIAETLISEWLKTSNHKWTYRKGQDMRKIYDKGKALVEVVKYGTKIFTEPDPNKKGQKTPPKIYLKALYTILLAMKGHRLFDRFGFNLPSAPKQETKQVWSTDYEEWQFNLYVQDWFNPKTGELLTNYVAPEELLDLLKNNINKDLD